MGSWDGNAVELGDPLPVGSGRPLTLDPDDRARHMYVVGATRSGKTRFLESLIRQDIWNWRDSRAGLLLVDPTGEIYDRLLAWSAEQDFHLPRPIVPIDLRRSDMIVAYNPLRYREGAEPSVIVENVASAMANVWDEPDFAKTPLIRQIMMEVLRALYEARGTIPDGHTLLSFVEKAARREMIDRVGEDVGGVFERANKFTKPNDYSAEFGGALRRFEPFAINANIRTALGQAGVSFDFEKAIAEGSIVLVAVSSEGSQVSQEQARLYATLLLADLWRTAEGFGKGRSRKPFYVYIDEFQKFMMKPIADSFDQAAGYGLHFTVAHQNPSQFRNSGDLGKQILDSVTGNAQTKVAFRLEAPDDLEFITNMIFGGTFDPMKIKHQIMSPVFDGYKTIILRSRATTTTSGGETTTEIPGGSTLFSGVSAALDPDGETVATNESSGRSDSDPQTITSSAAPQTSETESEGEHREAMYKREVTSVQFLPLEEQAQLAGLIIRGQNQRFGTVRMPTGDPRPFQTAEVKNSRYPKAVLEPFVEAFYQQLVQPLDYVLPRAEAEANLGALPRSLEHQERAIQEEEVSPPRLKMKPPMSP